jgi:hypothetical protein
MPFPGNASPIHDDIVQLMQNGSALVPYASTEELVATLASMPDRVAEVLRQAGADAVERTSLPSEDADATWNARQVLGHLGDSSRYWGARFFRTVFEDEPQLPGVDQDALMLAFAHRYRTPDELLMLYRLASAGNVALLRGLPLDAWQRVGIHAERGRMTLYEMVEVQTNHEQIHVHQLREALGMLVE